MSRINLKNLLEQAPFDVTIHISLNLIQDLLRNAMLHSIINSQISTTPKEHGPSAINPNGYTETSTVDLHAPNIELIIDNNQEIVPIPLIMVKNDDGEEVKLRDPDYPEDKEDWDFFLRFTLDFTVITNNQDLTIFNVTTINGNMTALVKPYYSPSTGIGFMRYVFEVNAISTAPTNLIGIGSDVIEQRINDNLLSSFYPKIIELLPKITLPLPDLQGLKVQAIKFFTNYDFDLPPTLTIGLGGEGGRSEDLLPLLNQTDGLAVSVSKAFFDKQIELFNQINDQSNATFSKGTPNFEKKRYEKIRWLKLELIENGLYLHTKFDIESWSIFEPDAVIEIEGPLTLSLTSDKTKAQLKADDSKLDVDIDIGFGWDFLRGFADLLSLGFAELYFSPEMRKQENTAAKTSAGKIASQMQSSLLGAFPSRKEILGHDDIIIRESAVFLAEPDTMEIHPTGLMINGPACGGIMRKNPSFNVTAVYRKNNTIKAFAFNNKFWMWKERAIQHWQEGTLKIAGVELVTKRDGTNYLRDYADRDKSDNLLSQPFFNPKHTDLVDGNVQELLDAPQHYLYDHQDLLVRLDELD